MKYCTECGKKIANTYKFCPDCGQPVIAEEDIVYSESSNFVLVENHNESNLENNVPSDVSEYKEVSEFTHVINKNKIINNKDSKQTNDRRGNDIRDLATIEKKEIRISNAKLNISDVIQENFKMINLKDPKIKKAVIILGCVCTISAVSIGVHKSLSKDKNVQVEESYAHLAEKNLITYNNESINNDYIIPESSDLVVSVDSLNNYSSKELFIARNEIIARHGFVFKDCPKLQSYFECKSWYKPDVNFSGKLDNKVETSNLSTIASMEFLKMAYEENNQINSEYVIPDSNVRELNSQDIKNLSDWELLVAKNEIYARYGFKFTTKELKKYFNSKNWYSENESGDNNFELNNIEYKNIDIIVSEQDKRMIKKLNHDL